MDKKMSFGKFIAKRRKLMRLTQEDLASLIGVSKSAVAKWEINGGLPDRDNLKRLSEVIGVSGDDLHRVITRGDSKDVDLRINITPDVIASLESFGYKVIRPEEDGFEEED